MININVTLIPRKMMGIQCFSQVSHTWKEFASCDSNKFTQPTNQTQKSYQCIHHFLDQLDQSQWSRRIQGYPYGWNHGCGKSLLPWDLHPHTSWLSILDDRVDKQKETVRKDVRSRNWHRWWCCFTCKYVVITFRATNSPPGIPRNWAWAVIWAVTINISKTGQRGCVITRWDADHCRIVSDPGRETVRIVGGKSGINRNNFDWDTTSSSIGKQVVDHCYGFTSAIPSVLDEGAKKGFLAGCRAKIKCTHIVNETECGETRIRAPENITDGYSLVPQDQCLTRDTRDTIVWNKYCTEMSKNE